MWLKNLKRPWNGQSERANLAHGRVAFEGENQAEKEAALTKQDGAAAAGAAQDGYAVGLAGGFVHFLRQPAAGAEDHRILGPFPQAQHLHAPARLGGPPQRPAREHLLNL